MMHEVLTTEYYRVHFDPAIRLIRLTRTAVPQTLPVLDASVKDLLALTMQLRPAHVLLDMRLAPGNNDTAFEQHAMTALNQLKVGFGELAVLVQSAVGRLHFQRMSRASGSPIPVFFDESEALQFLAEQPLPGHSPK